MGKEVLLTKFGAARLNDDGYYKITSSKEGNNGKLLHRLIFEDFYQIILPKHILIHHNDGNKMNNNIWNLIPMTKKEHNFLHWKGKQHQNNTKLKMSLLKNSTGYFRVSKHFNNNVKQGFVYVYRYYVNGKEKRISSVSFSKLREKVLKNNLEWKIVNEELAQKTAMGVNV